MKSLYRACLIVVTSTFVFATTLTTASRAESEYADPPAPLLDALNTAIKGVLVADQAGDAEPEAKLDTQIRLIAMYAIADAVSTLPRRELLRGLKSTREATEAARTDKQIGATPGFLGSTSIVEKASLPRLLSMAIEGGAVQSDTSSTLVTLTTTPYAMLAMFVGDSHENYKRFDWMTRLGVGATFPLDQELSEIGGKDLNQFTASYRLLGDRSSRSETFNNKWKETAGKHMKMVVALESGSLDDFYAADTSLRRHVNGVGDDMTSYVRNYLVTDATKKDDAKLEELREYVLNVIQKRILEPIEDGSLVIKPEVRKIVDEKIVPNAAEANKKLRDAKVASDKAVKELEKQPVLTLGYAFRRLDSDTELSELKILYDQPIAGNTLLINAFASIDHDPDESLEEKRVPDYGFALSWQRMIRNTITKNFNDEDSKPISVSLDLRLTRLEMETDAQLSGQLRLSLPIGMGFELPVSATYASRTREVDDAEFSVSAGLSLDADALSALSALSALQ